MNCPHCKSDESYRLTPDPAPHPDLPILYECADCEWKYYHDAVTNTVEGISPKTLRAAQAAQDSVRGAFDE